MKHVLQNKKYKNRELDILQQINHKSIVRLHHYFFKEETQGSRTLPAGTYLDLVMEYVPDTLSRVVKQMHASKLFLEREKVIGYSRSLLEALQYLHVRMMRHRKTRFAIGISSHPIYSLMDWWLSYVISGRRRYWRPGRRTLRTFARGTTERLSCSSGLLFTRSRWTFGRWGA